MWTCANWWARLLEWGTMEPMEGPVVSKSGCALKSSCELWVGAGWGRGRNKQNSPTPRPNFQKSCTARAATAFVRRSGIPRMWRGPASGGDSGRGQARAMARPEDSKEWLVWRLILKLIWQTQSTAHGVPYCNRNIPRKTPSCWWA